MNQYVFEEERPVVDTKCGKIRGIAYGGVNIFMGIDYAKAKRFQMPVEIEPWEGIKMPISMDRFQNRFLN